VENVQTSEKIMLSVKEFADISGIGVQRIRQIIHIDGFPAVRSGNRVLIHRVRADAWLAAFAKAKNGNLPFLG